MDDLRAILLTHASRYPAMEPTDAVKLLYQNEFGGGHLIRDEAQCLGYLRSEYARTPQRPDIPLAEDIGNNMVRVHLAGLDAHGYPVDQLGSDFIRSAQNQTGSLPSFLSKLALLRQLAKEDLLPFSSDALKQYLADYEKAGYPMVSHSAQYRSAYSPAYRVIHRSYLSVSVL